LYLEKKIYSILSTSEIGNKNSFLPLVAVAVGEDNASVESAIDQV
jgi:hypothetical protein